MPIKKRRVPKSPNKNIIGIMRRQGQENQARGAGVLGARYGGVDQLQIQMQFVSREGHILGEEDRVFGANDTVNFTAHCPGRCGNGKTFLDEKINRLTGSHQTSSETMDVCKEMIHHGANEVCGCELRCKITVSYLD
jgi:hypothetical protein